jgi:hypothetical protein
MEFFNLHVYPCYLEANGVADVHDQNQHRHEGGGAEVCR